MSWFKIRTSNVLGGEVADTRIFGASWDGSSSSIWTRTDDASLFVDPIPQYSTGNGTWSTGSSPFDDIMPWAGMVVSEDSEAGTLVAIPKFYYKMGYASGTTGLKIQISPSQFEGSNVSPAHQDRGDGKGERDVVYIGRYHCSNSGYKSTSGYAPTANLTRAEFRSGIHNLGSTIWQNDYAMIMTLWLLYLVEFADWNSQAKIGGGCSTSGSIMNVGYTDSMTYHTGTTATSIGRTTYGGTQYRNIEGLWDNVLDWCDGVVFSSSTIYAALNPNNYSDSTTNYTNVGTRPTSSNYISKFTISTANGFDWFMYPSAVSGGEATYISDYCYYYSSGVVLFVGGDYGQGQGYGLFFLFGYGAASFKSAGIGSRLQKLP